jgi:uncharacterized protein (TIGR03905 family)
MVKSYIPSGVCSKRFDIVIEDGIIQELSVIGGCNGNLKGISALVKGQKVEDVIDRLSGIQCGPRTTSCPDQIARALKEALEEAK